MPNLGWLYVLRALLHLVTCLTKSKDYCSEASGMDGPKQEFGTEDQIVVKSEQASICPYPLLFMIYTEEKEGL